LPAFPALMAVSLRFTVSIFGRTCTEFLAMAGLSPIPTILSLRGTGKKMNGTGSRSHLRGSRRCAGKQSGQKIKITQGGLNGSGSWSHYLDEPKDAMKTDR